MTMFIMAGMMIVAASSSYIVVLGIKAGGIQAQSTKAYFLAESGAERLLFEMRKGGDFTWNSDPDFSEVAYENETDDFVLGGSYEVFHIALNRLLYRSVGDFGNTKRAVEIDI